MGTAAKDVSKCFDLAEATPTAVVVLTSIRTDRTGATPPIILITYLKSFTD